MSDTEITLSDVVVEDDKRLSVLVSRFEARSARMEKGLKELLLLAEVAMRNGVSLRPKNLRALIRRALK